MAHLSKADAAIRNPSWGFTAWQGSPSKMPAAHTHTDVEWNLVCRGRLRYFMGGQFTTVESGNLGIFWGGMPHRLLETADDSLVIWVTIPLAMFMQWDIDPHFTARMLRGEMLAVGGDAEGSQWDQWMFMRWAKELPKATPRQRRTILLEVEARLRRHVNSVLEKPAVPPRKRVGGADSLGPIEQMATFMARHFQEELSVADIAAAVDLHPNYATQLFKRGCGMNLWEYLIQLRLSHAQRLLLTTDEKITRIALESGFGSQGRFYAMFAKTCRQSPRQYRMAMRGVE